jgi:hypothetical protein
MLRKMLLFLGLLMAACGGGAETAVPRADSISCNAAYRAGVGMPIESEESFILDDEASGYTMFFSELTLNAQYSSGELDHERALRLWVTEAGETAELTSQLYQLPLDSGPVDQFIGGHGFTGLNYVYHPESGAELQFWCAAADQ